MTLLITFATACGASNEVIPLLTAAGIPLTQPTTVPLRIVTRSTAVQDPISVRGSSVAYTDVEAALGHAVSSATVPWADAHRASTGSKEGWELLVEVINDGAQYQDGRILFSVAVRATLHQRAGNVYLAQTQASCRQAQTEQKRMELQAEAEQRKLAATTETEVTKIEIQKKTEEEKGRLESALRNKEAERRVTREQAAIDKMKADADAATRVAQARGEATARLAIAKATAEEAKASAADITPLTVQMHAYDALGKLGGTGTTFMLGDYSKLPGWLFPHVPGFESAFSPGYAWPGAPAVIPSVGQGQLSANTPHGGKP